MATDKIKLKRAQAEQIVDMLAKDHTVVGPKKKTTRYAFEVVTSPKEIEWDFNQTIQSPKAFFFPPVEMLLKYTLGNNPSIEKPALKVKPIAIVGAHPCDINATWLLDIAFSSNNEDPSYKARRDQSIVIGIDCTKPCDEFAFCRQMGTMNATDKFDLLLTPVGSDFVATVGSDRGKKLLDAVGAKEVGDQDAEAAQVAKDKAFAECNAMKTSVDALPALMEKSMEHPIWEEQAEKCFSCGSCNLVCPTCYCFDVKDDPALTMDSAKRWRRWDGCVLKGFAIVASGENFREEKADRLRHRFFRKGKYLLERFEKPGCVGCGRCSRTCLAQIYAHETYNALTEERAHERVS